MKNLSTSKLSGMASALLLVSAVSACGGGATGQEASNGANPGYVSPSYGEGDAGMPTPEGEGETPTTPTTPGDEGTTPTPAPTPEPGTEAPAPTPSESGTAVPYALGTMPAGYSVTWPTPPAITNDVTVTTRDEALAAAATPGTRVHVAGAIDGDIDVSASDVEIVFEPGASANAVFIGNQLQRIAVRGGSVDHVEFELAMDPANGTFHRELLSSDVLIDGVQADADDIAFLVRAGVRVAIVNSVSRAARYSVWIGDSGDFNSEDVILANNDFDSAGPEATVRLVNVTRSATVDNRLTNTFKHNYRVHGRSSHNWASGNLLVNSGVMLGTMDADVIDHQYFENNTFHHTLPSLIQLDEDMPNVTLKDNVVYSDVWDCFGCIEFPAAWVVENNTMNAYQAPPAR